ncbi:MAG: 30S ribosomal protein S12 methylthiotransferase RimO [Syntrophales bacterium]
MGNRKIHIVNLGCPKNLVDSEVMAAALSGGGFEISSREETAHIILVNTCAFILPAKKESIEEILRLAEWKKRGRCRYLIVTGCLAQRYGKMLRKQLPEVDLFLGTGEVGGILGHVNRLLKDGPEEQPFFDSNPSFLMNSAHRRLLSTHYSAYLKIAEGCSNHCSYCIIPSVRGEFRSRQLEDIIRETESLAFEGVREVILIAQDTASYGRDLAGEQSLGRLLREIAAVDGIRWIRVLYAHPASVSAEILEAIAGEEKVCKYIDMPVQHIDDDILSAMRRRGGSNLIKDRILQARSLIPGLVLRTSIMVGFPGETTARFNRLLAFIKETRFQNLGVFVYSREEGTAAAEMSGHVPEREKEKRRDILMEEQAAISCACNRSLVGSVMEVIIEGKSDLPGYLVARHRGQSPEIDGVTYVKAANAAAGDIINCVIRSADEYDLFAEAVDEPRRQ